MNKRSHPDSEDREYSEIARKIKKLERKLARVRTRRKNREDQHSHQKSSPQSSTASSSDSSSSSSHNSQLSRHRHRNGNWSPLTPRCSETQHEPVPSTSTAATAACEQGSTVQRPPSHLRTLPAPSAPTPAQSVQTPGQLVSPSQSDLPGQMTQPEPVLAEPSQLNDELLKLLGEDPSKEKTYGKEIQPDLAIRLKHIATTGLSKEARKELLDRYLPPANCTLIDAPTLNPEVRAAISEQVLKRDKGIELRQKQNCATLTCLTEVLTSLLSSEPTNAMLVKLMMDAVKLLADTQHADSIVRRNFVLFGLRKELKDHLQTTKIDKLLFSEDLPDALKIAKAISKTGADLKVPAPAKPTTSSKKHYKPQKNLNWRAAPPNHRPKTGQQQRPTKEPVHKNRQDNFSRQPSRPVQGRSHR